MSTNEPLLVTFTIYERPKDYPDKFVVRRWAIIHGQPQPQPEGKAWAVADSLEMVRGSLPPGLVRTERHPEDDPVIVETWV
jgi:hypothetical protein